MVDPSRVRVSGALAPFAAGFMVALAAEGRPPNGSVKQLQLMAHLSRWLEAEGLGPADVEGEVIARFFVARRAAGYRDLRTPMAAGSLLAYLRGVGVVPAAVAPVPQGPVEEMLLDYERYLVRERGVLAETARDYARSARPLLEGLADGDRIDLVRLDGPAVVAFVVARCPEQSRSSAKRTVKALRSLLGFLHVEGHIERPLAHTVPTASGWRLAGLPRHLEPGQVRRLLAACDLRTAAGRRDLAVLTVLARLGLRACEIVALSLDDIDWRAGELVVHGKGARVDRLPLPVDVGEAIVAWLQDGRPATATCRAVFVRVRGPHRGLSRAGVTQIVASAAERAGLRWRTHRGCSSGERCGRRPMPPPRMEGGTSLARGPRLAAAGKAAVGNPRLATPGAPIAWNSIAPVPLLPFHGCSTGASSDRVPADACSSSFCGRLRLGRGHAHMHTRKRKRGEVVLAVEALAFRPRPTSISTPAARAWSTSSLVKRTGWRAVGVAVELAARLLGVGVELDIAALDTLA